MRSSAEFACLSVLSLPAALKVAKRTLWYIMPILKRTAPVRKLASALMIGSRTGADDTAKERCMAEDKVELREINYRQVLPWTELFKGFQLALDPKKLVLAAAGILAMYAGWWLLSVIF